MQIARSRKELALLYSSNAEVLIINPRLGLLSTLTRIFIFNYAQASGMSSLASRAKKIMVIVKYCLRNILERNISYS